MPYKLVMGQTSNIEDSVNREMASGWFPVGGLTVSATDNRLVIQAMTRNGARPRSRSRPPAYPQSRGGKRKTRKT